MIVGADWVLPVDGPPLRDGAVRVQDGVIQEVSADLEPTERFEDAVILPGLVNAHTHLDLSGCRAPLPGASSRALPGAARCRRWRSRSTPTTSARPRG